MLNLSRRTRIATSGALFVVGSGGVANLISS